MRRVNRKKSPSQQLPEIPDRYELTEYIQGRLSRNRRKEIREILESGHPAAKGARLDLEEIKNRLKAMPFKPLNGRSSKEIQDRMAAVLNHSGGPAPGEIWSLRTQESASDFSHERSVFILYVRGNFARVAPVTKEIDFAGPRDLIVRDHAFASVPFVLELFTSFWIDISLLTEKGEFEACISEKILSSTRKADRGIYTNLPRGVKRGSTNEISDVEEFHEEWQEGERVLFEKFKTAPYVLQEFETSIVQPEPAKEPIVFSISSLSYQQPTQYVYHLAAADQTIRISDFQFWEKERNLLKNSRLIMLKAPTFEVRLSTVEGHLFLIVERGNELLKSVSGVSLSRKSERISTTEGSVDFTSSYRVHLHFEIDPTLQLNGRWTLGFRLDNDNYEKEIDFQ